MDIPIAILTKGRSEELLTLDLLKEPLKDKQFILFIEPDEVKQYTKHISSNVTLQPFISQSTSYGDAINKVFKYFKDKKIQHFWLLDDDIDHIYYRTVFNEEKQYWHMRDTSHEQIVSAFEECEAKMIDNDFSQLAFSYRQTNPFFLDDWKINHSCSVMVLMNNKYVDGHAPWCTVWGDIELSLRMIYNNHDNCICYKYAFGYPGMSKNAGGLADYYNSKKAEEETLIIVNKVISIYGPDIVKCVYKKHHGERLAELSISWKTLEQRRHNKTLW